ncbi:VWA domain-containing protein, partial [Candidatus Woesearchaeota archaeon]|nr:VWA domain-containing protein [Candidatus Woesearchaeota archaeon]
MIRNKIALMLAFGIVVAACAGSEVLSCADDQTIMRLDAATNAHGALWNFLFTPIKHNIDSGFDQANDAYAADIDGDGDADVLAAAGGFTDEIAWYENDNGNGNSWTKRVIGASFDGVSVHAADIDGDNDMDVLAADSDNDEVAWYENDNGDGSSWTKHVLDGSLDMAFDAYAADIDGDNDMDVLAAAQGKQVGPGGIVWYENDNGDGSSWTTRFIAAGLEGYSVYAIDIDGDSYTDVIGSEADNAGVYWWKNDNGDGTSWTLHTIGSFEYTDVHAADIDGDGDADVLGASSQTDRVYLWKNDNGDGSSWTQNIIDPNFNGAQTAYAIDIDGDGDIDAAAAARNDDEISWYENDNGNGNSWTKHVVDAAFSGASSAYAIDIDGDGDIDILGSAAAGDEIAWWEMEPGYDICYPDIFGVPYTGSNPHQCTGTNKVAGLDQPGNAHGQIPEKNDYAVDVCYGDLSCRSINTSKGESCTPSEKAVVTLDRLTNAHFDAGGYEIEICCTSGPTLDGNIVTEYDYYTLTHYSQVNTYIGQDVKLKNNTIPGVTAEYELWVNVNNSIPSNNDVDVNYTLLVNVTKTTNITVNGSGFESAEIVWIVDRSGSMQNDIQAVRHNAQIFADELSRKGIPFRLGVVDFEYYSAPIGSLTSDINAFRSNLNQIRPSGGTENGLSALDATLSHFNFNPNSKKFFILLTDEDSDDYTGNLGTNLNKLPQTINLMNNNDVTVYTVCMDPDAAGYAVPEYNGPNSVANQTGGKRFNLLQPFHQLLGEMGFDIAKHFTMLNTSWYNYTSTVVTSEVPFVSGQTADQMALAAFPQLANPEYTINSYEIILNWAVKQDGGSHVESIIEYGFDLGNTLVKSGTRAQVGDKNIKINLTVYDSTGNSFVTSHHINLSRGLNHTDSFYSSPTLKNIIELYNGTAYSDVPDDIYSQPLMEIIGYSLVSGRVSPLPGSVAMSFGSGGLATASQDDTIWLDYFPPAPTYSYLKSYTDSSFHLLMRVDYNASGTWISQGIVHNDTVERSMSAGELLELDDIWNNLPWNTNNTRHNGTFRAYAAAARLNGDVYEYNGKKMEFWHPFNVTIKTIPALDCGISPDEQGFGLPVMAYVGAIPGITINNAAATITLPDSTVDVVNLADYGNRWSSTINYWQNGTYSYSIVYFTNKGAGMCNGTFEYYIDPGLHISPKRGVYIEGETVELNDSWVNVADEICYWRFGDYVCQNVSRAVYNGSRAENNGPDFNLSLLLHLQYYNPITSAWQNSDVVHNAAMLMRRNEYINFTRFWNEMGEWDSTGFANGTYRVRAALTNASGDIVFDFRTNPAEDYANFTLKPRCNLTAAFWAWASNGSRINGADVYNGTIVNLNVTGKDCGGRMINYTIWEDDIGFLFWHDKLVYSGPSSAWPASWIHDGFGQGDPEFFFNASAGWEDYIISDLLHVIKSPACG